MRTEAIIKVDPEKRRHLRLATLAPLVALAGLIGFLAVGLGRDPREIPSVLIGKPVPMFELPPVQGRSLGLSSADLKGEVSLDGLNYKDPPADARKWLDEMGDPYTRTGADIDGRVAIDWGVYGVPETFVRL